MPVTVSYPGVYIEEIPSGVRTITGVATSITAFIGWSARGPVDRAQRVLSWPDFERSFGGLDSRSLLGYAVYQFFGNGGSDAYVIRLTDQASPASFLVHPAETITQRAVSPSLRRTLACGRATTASSPGSAPMTRPVSVWPSSTHRRVRRARSSSSHSRTSPWRPPTGASFRPWSTPNPNSSTSPSPTVLSPPIRRPVAQARGWLRRHRARADHRRLPRPAQ